MTDMQHTPVLLQEVVQWLALRPGMRIVDGTLGAGGHAEAIIPAIMPDGMFVGIDWDKDVLSMTRERLEKKFAQFKDRMFFVHGNYADVREVLKKLSLDRVDGMVADLGFSSWHITDSGRGFSFNTGDILDMRYDTSLGVPAYQVVNGFSEQDIADIIFRYSQERYSRRIARLIVRERQQEKIMTADRLRDIIHEAVPGSYRRGKINPATKTFQALRIYVNQELENVEQLLKSIRNILKPKGRICIISFHSMEDRLVKQYFRSLVHAGEGEVLTKKPIVPDAQEIDENPKSRSAKLRVFKKSNS